MYFNHLVSCSQTSFRYIHSLSINHFVASQSLRRTQESVWLPESGYMLWVVWIGNFLIRSALAWPILDIGGMGAFFGGTFSEKRLFCLLARPKQMSLNISNENIFLETQGTRLGVIVAPSKGLA